ncbi:MAG: glycerophosphodiester phosphodiesterase, partial [Ectopseudomonas oleovorans]
MSKSLSAWILGVTLLPLSVFASPTQDNVQAAIDWAQQQPSA